MNPGDPAKVYLCAKCGRTSESAGDCPEHPDEPLLDTTDRQVRFFLMHLDDQARNRTYGFWITAGMVVGAVAGIALAVLGNRYIEEDSFPTSRALIIGGIAGASLGTAVARWRFVPRFASYTKPLENVGVKV